MQRDAIVVGGGLYGCAIAAHLRQRGANVLLLEREAELLARASSRNQARLHGGYHYPRSVLTGLRSRVNLPRFLADFSDCIAGTGTQLYAVARRFSNVTAAQFATFCRRIGASCDVEDGPLRRAFEPAMIEEVFRVQERFFDATALRGELEKRLERVGVDVVRGAHVLAVARGDGGGIDLRWRTRDEEHVTSAARVYNCTYASLNGMLSDSGLPLVPLRYERAELALVQPPPALHGVGITVVCGPFFSFSPFPMRSGLHALSHVRYTPAQAWHDGEQRVRTSDPRGLVCAPRISRFRHMLQDAQRYVPSLGEARYVESLWETKAVLPRSAGDDGRPILLRHDHGLPGLTCVLGGKLDNVYDVLDELDVAERAA